jgi:MOSC domain-containing protein YiiM
VFEGRIESIWIGPAHGEPLTSVPEAHAVAGEGIDGDRHYGRAGEGRDLTLVEAESIQAIRDEAGIELVPGGTRRNVVTRGVPLNHLVGREFRVGDVVLRGVRLCEPCEYISELTGHDLRNALQHRAGLRADIVQSGTLRVGDAVRVVEAAGAAPAAAS